MVTTTTACLKGDFSHYITVTGVIIIIIIIITIFISVKTYRSKYNDDIYMYTLESSVTQDRNNKFSAVGC